MAGYLLRVSGLGLPSVFGLRISDFSSPMKHLALIIEPTAAQLNIFSAFTLPRLGSFILAGLVCLLRDKEHADRKFILTTLLGFSLLAFAAAALIATACGSSTA